jgi:hypothetical protein
LPGKRVDAQRAGIIPTQLSGLMVRDCVTFSVADSRWSQPHRNNADYPITLGTRKKPSS